MIISLMTLRERSKYPLRWKNNVPMSETQSLLVCFPTSAAIVGRRQQLHQPLGCCLWRVMAAFVVNVSELPFTHLHITCPIPRKPIISTCAGTDARVSAKETCLLCRARRRKRLRIISFSALGYLHFL